MRNENPAENRNKFPGLASRKVKFEGKIGRKDEFYEITNELTLCEKKLGLMRLCQDNMSQQKAKEWGKNLF